MPHQCVRCGSFFADDAKEIMHGCSSCSGKLFFYVKPAKVEQAKSLVEELTDEQKEELQTAAEDLTGQEVDEAEQIVVLDLETIRVVAPGKYELDLVQLFDSSKPLIYKMGDGKYVVDLVQTFERFSKAKKP